MSNQLLNCARCGKPVSSGVFKCPHCGEKKFKYIPCHHCNVLTEGFEIIDYGMRELGDNGIHVGKVYVKGKDRPNDTYLQKPKKTYHYCPDCYFSIIQLNRNISLPIIPQIKIKCPTCNHLFNYQPQPTKDSLSYRLSYEYYNENKNTDTGYIPCPNCGEPNCEGVFYNPYVTYVKCFWCDGVLNHHDGVEAYSNPSQPYQMQLKIYLHKNCATKKNLEALNVKRYSPSELFWFKVRWVSEYIPDGIFATIGLMIVFLIIHYILRSVMNVNILPIFVITSIAIGTYVGYNGFSKDFKKNKNITGKD